MNHALVVHVLQPKYHARDHELCLWLREPPANPNVIAQITPCQQIRDQVERLSILERVVDIHQKGMLQLLKQFFLTHN